MSHPKRSKMETAKVNETGLEWYLKNRQAAEKKADELMEQRYKLWLEAQAKRKAENR